MIVKRISILGVGFIGKNLLNSYLNNNYLIKVLDLSPCPEMLHNKVEWIQGSFGNSANLLSAIKGSDVVFHLISSTVPGDDVTENEEILNNVVQTLNLLRICVQENVQRIVFISSASVYGIQHKLPIFETASTDPISSHGVHKLTIEKYLLLYKYKYSLNCKIMRLSNPYGFGQDVFGRQGLVSIGIGKILTDDAITIMGDGTAIRDFIYIDDVIRACHMLAETDTEEVVFNIGSGKGIRINDVINEFQYLTKKPLNTHYIGGRKNDISASVLDVQKAKKILGFQTNTSFKDGLRRTLSLYQEKYPQLHELLIEVESQTTCNNLGYTD
jgi:UDP-glucose 4-epimerase